jgi:hypothetical protein
MAFAKRPDTTVIVEFGKVRPFTDIAGRYVVRLDDTPKQKHRLAERLRAIGCAVDTTGSDWLAIDLTPPEQKAASEQNAESPGTATPRKSHTSVAAQTDRRPELDNFSVVRDSLGLHTVHGEARTNGTAVSWLRLKATFYADTKIIGTATGSVRDLEPGETKTFSLTTTDDVGGYDDYRVQIETVR